MEKRAGCSYGSNAGVSQPAGTALRAYQAYAYTERSAKISATTLNVRSGPGTSNASVARLNKNAAVTVIGETTGSDGKLWYQIRFTGRKRSDDDRICAGNLCELPHGLQSRWRF